MPQFIITAIDFKDSEALQRRLAIRNNHLDRMKIEKTKGRFVIGGAILSEEGKMTGSSLIIEIENKEAAIEWLKIDPYVVGKVWESFEIKPFKVAAV